MNIFDMSVVAWVPTITLNILTLALFISLIRLVRGPSLPDRVVALDLMSILSAGIIGVYAIRTRQAVYLDVASVLALISFLGVVAFSRYLEKRGTE